LVIRILVFIKIIPHGAAANAKQKNEGDQLVDNIDYGQKSVILNRKVIGIKGNQKKAQGTVDNDSECINECVFYEQAFSGIGK